MDNVEQPIKERVRHYMEQRQAERSAPPSIEEIRRRLGWNMILRRVDWTTSEYGSLKL